MKKPICFFFSLAVCFCASFHSFAQNEPSTVVVMSYNIRMGEANDGTNSWQYRYPATAMMIMDQQPDVMGVQEAFDYQVNYISDVCENYKAVGVGREDGKHDGEHMSIFYNTKTISLMKWGTFWLSETPQKPSKGWDAECIRTATWAILKKKKSGEKFLMVNTHLDHIGTLARKNGLELILSEISKINVSGIPVVVTGDFNMTISDPSIKPISETMQNSREVAAITDDITSYNGWGREKNQKIDYIWFCNFSSCVEFKTITDSYFDRKFISDHYPVKAKLVF